jgi:membrane protein DedA with SNARE-associated domain
VPISSTAVSLLAAASTNGSEEFTGISRIALDVITALGEFGVAVLVFVETIFPPIPSEIILALAGFQATQGQLNVVLVVVAATLGGYLGAVVLYWIGRLFGEERSVHYLAKLPLVYRSDFEASAAWLHKHGRGAVFFGRLVPLVRSLISLPAGATRMPFVSFTIFTLAGSAIWNTLLVGAGYLLGQQYELIAEYSDYLNYVVYAAIVGVLVFLVVRAIRRHRRGDEVV